MFTRLILVAICISCSVAAAPTTTTTTTTAPGPKTETFTIDGVQRQALVFAPTTNAMSGAGQSPPIVFGWHGHGGSMQGGPTLYAIQSAWPEAVVVYPQGLLSPSANDPNATKSGWQFAPGDSGDRDLKFFDAMLARFSQQFSFDKKRVYSVGFSNGGIFSYLLWHSRESTLAAVAICEAPLLDTSKPLKALPAFVIAGKADTMVPFATQQTAIQYDRTVDGVAPDAMPNAKNAGVAYFKGTSADLAIDIHDGGHEYPQGTTAFVVPFLKAHARP